MPSDRPWPDRRWSPADEGFVRFEGDSGPFRPGHATEFWRCARCGFEVHLSWAPGVDRDYGPAARGGIETHAARCT